LVPHLPEVGLGGVIAYQNKSASSSIPAKQALLIVAALGILGLLMFLLVWRDVAAQMQTKGTDS
jgi:hypothetical protein